MKTSASRKQKAVGLILTVLIILLGGLAMFRLLDQRGLFLPSWTKQQNAKDPGGIWKNRSLSGDSLRLELSSKKAAVSVGENPIWTSPKEVLVQDLLYEDIDRDGAKEIILLCWRRGSFGEHRPFWVSANDNRWGQHIFIYDYAPENTVYPNPVHAIWMSSAIPMDITAISYDPSRQALYVRETDERITGWAWLSWGLEMVSEESSVSFLCAGDLLVHEPIYAYGLSYTETFDFLFQQEDGLPQRIRSADVAVLGQETPLVDDPLLYGGYPDFGTPWTVGEAAANAGFDIASCATNHALDRGMKGIDITLKTYRDNDVLPLGIQGTDEQARWIPYQLLTRQGIRFALFSLTYGTNGRPMPASSPYAVHLLPDPEDGEALEKLRTALKTAREEADCVIVFAHWGTEYENQPDELQQFYSDLFLQAGVDVVVGSHPHVIQPMETLTAENGHVMLIYYSLGNLISGNQDPAQNSGALGCFNIKKAGDEILITDSELVKIDSIFRVEIPTD